MLSRTRLLLVLLFLSLAGCVTFERSPLPLACDARLEGRWLPIANSAEEAEKLTTDDYATVDGQCHATLSMSQTADKPARKAEVQASGFALGGEHYLVLGEKDLIRLFAGSDTLSPDRTPGSSVSLVRYRIQGDILKLETIDVDTVKRMVDQHELSARAQDQLNYVIPGDEAQLRDVLLKHPGLFGQGQAPPMTLRRAPALETP
ncbi:hypothetical protein CSC74_01575 [Pseudoxanthomonas yeongjuensis]|uniref:hypothetical protein n=1 Tax=Pseudoxanthomonas yeongjuensis TaxID=377616 RepID=UPI001390A8CC|nr:hypothetical protein [Pseudoxanthomonas yeongjuensis]KAF1717643.1 hypothetical protein CSC74_01575 [Pseudoxanthomonas yeongjuensis]